MPYTHRKVGDKQCVYKKDGGTKVGCTKGSVEKYLAALHANANESISEINTIKGGKADKMSVEDIAKKFNVSVENQTYPIIVTSNSTVTEFSFNATAKELNFKASGQTGTSGFCTISIPANLIWGDISVYKDGSPLVKDVSILNPTMAHITFSR